MNAMAMHTWSFRPLVLASKAEMIPAIFLIWGVHIILPLMLVLILRHRRVLHYWKPTCWLLLVLPFWTWAMLLLVSTKGKTMGNFFWEPVLLGVLLSGLIWATTKQAVGTSNPPEVLCAIGVAAGAAVWLIC